MIRSPALRSNWTRTENDQQDKEDDERVDWTDFRAIVLRSENQWSDVGRELSVVGRRCLPKGIIVPGEDSSFIESLELRMIETRFGDGHMAEIDSEKECFAHLLTVAFIQQENHHLKQKSYSSANEANLVLRDVHFRSLVAWQFVPTDWSHRWKTSHSPRESDAPWCNRHSHRHARIVRWYLWSRRTLIEGNQRSSPYPRFRTTWIHLIVEIHSRDRPTRSFRHRWCLSAVSSTGNEWKTFVPLIGRVVAWARKESIDLEFSTTQRTDARDRREKTHLLSI